MGDGDGDGDVGDGDISGDGDSDSDGDVNDEDDGDLPEPPSCGAEPVGLAAVAQFERLPYLRHGVQALGFSSADRNTYYGNDDYSQYLSSANGEFTLFDAQGPGTIARFWRATRPGAGEYRFYFDGEATPSFVMGRDAFWSAANAPFVAPFSLDKQASSGGELTLLPINFAKSLRIVGTTPPDKDYYQIDYFQFGDRRTVNTGFGDTQFESKAKAILSAAGANPIAAKSSDQKATGNINVGAGQTQQLAMLTGPREIVELRLHIPNATSAATQAAMASARLQITWDGEATPAVDAPLAMFFAHGNGIRPSIHALPVGNSPPGGGVNDFYSYFPMPFRQSAKVAIRQEANQGALNDISFEITHRAFSDDFERVGTFHTVYRRMAQGQAQVFDVRGAGNYVGLVLVPPTNGGLEGDNRIYIDGLASPTHLGTGTEDYFSGAWYYLEGSFSAPTHGAVLAADAPNGSNRVSQYRFHIPDLMPFSSGIELAWEIDAGTEALAYFYLAQGPAMEQSDEFDVGDSGAESAHSYATTGTKAANNLSAVMRDRTVQDTGNRLTRGSTVSFSMAVAADNQGVVLRRRFDHADGVQRVTVNVNGKNAGVWEVQPTGPADWRWREADFFLPPALTAGASKLDVTLTVQCDAYSEHRYTAFSVSRGEPECPAP